MSLKRNIVLLAAYFCALAFMTLPFALSETGTATAATGGYQDR